MKRNKSNNNIINNLYLLMVLIGIIMFSITIAPKKVQGKVEVVHDEIEIKYYKE